jgi:hypothetical protein
VSICYHWASGEKYLGWQAGVIGYDSEKGLHKDHSTKVWSQLAKLVSEEKILNDFFCRIFCFQGWLVHFKVHYQKSQSKMIWVILCAYLLIGFLQKFITSICPTTNKMT